MGRRLPEGRLPPRQLVRVNPRKDWLAAAVGLCFGVSLFFGIGSLCAQPPKVEYWVRRLPEGNRTTSPPSVCALRGKVMVVGAPETLESDRIFASEDFVRSALPLARCRRAEG